MLMKIIGSGIKLFINESRIHKKKLINTRLIMSNLSGKIVLITGGSSGIGFEMAKQMIAKESTVIICGRSQQKLENAKRKIPKLVTIQCDITKSEEREVLFKRISEQFKGLDMLMNNAGITKRYLFVKTNNLEEKIMEEWQTNYLAPVMLTSQLLPLLIKNKGTVVNVTSGLVYAPISIEPNYCATKAALHSMTQSLRLPLSKVGVKVVEIFYPAVDTPFQNGHAPKVAIKPDVAAAIALKGLNRGKDEIRVKMAGFLFLLARLMPKKAVHLINRVVPDNIEELLASE